jgi:hypothetical protein
MPVHDAMVAHDRNNEDDQADQHKANGLADARALAVIDDHANILARPYVCVARWKPSYVLLRRTTSNTCVYLHSDIALTLASLPRIMLCD